MKAWTKEETEFLQENWGHMTVAGLSKHLNRSVNAILIRKNKLGLGAYLDSGEYITLNQLLIAVTGTNNAHSYKQTSWVKNRGLPMHFKRVNNNTFRIVYLDEFWQWAEKNRSFINFSKMEPLALGEEPDWVAEQRRKDHAAFAAQRKDPWTGAEDSRLAYLLKQHKYGYSELSEMLHRSAGSIQRRCCDLGLKERPVKAEKRDWTEEDFEALADGIRNGESYTLIGVKIGVSEKAVRGKVYFTYLTENADKVRQMLGDGNWGDGAPIPTVKQAIHLSRTRSQVKKNLSVLDAVLRYRMNQLGYDPYFQRFMCMNWDDFEGCAAGQTNCDECAEFWRIKPQYCVRCGATFYERKENKMCKQCRKNRKKSYLRKMAVLNARKV